MTPLTMLFVALLLSLDSVTGEPVIERDTTMTEDGKTYKGTIQGYLDKDGRFIPHGVATYWSDSGSKKLEKHYANGLCDGVETEWYANGQRRLVFSYKRNVQDGNQTQWREDGTKEFEWNMREGRYHGVHISYDRHGRPQHQDAYVNGVQNGESVRWYENGNVESKRNMATIDGKVLQHGKSEVWYPDGQKLGEWYCHKGKIGTGRVWYANGKLAELTDLERGKGNYWDCKGNPVGELQWRDGKPWHGVYFHISYSFLQSGTDTFLIRYQDGKRSATESYDASAVREILQKPTKGSAEPTKPLD